MGHDPASGGGRPVEPTAGTATAAPACRPTGRPLERSDRARIEARLAPLRTAMHPHIPADYSFANLWLFREVRAHRVTDGPWPVVQGLTYDGAAYALPLFDVRQASIEVLRHLLVGGRCLYPLPLDWAQALPQRLAGHPSAGLLPQAQTRTHPHDADYLYAADSFRHYRGPLGRKKAQQLRQILADGGAPPRLERIDPTQRALAESVLRAWAARRVPDAYPTDQDPCEQALAHLYELGLQGWQVLRGAEAPGFALTETLAPDVAVVRFAKAADDRPGIHPFLFQRLALVNPGWRWLNFEQDLGHPGFRQADLAWGPVGMVGKGRLIL
jgi:hypothetical protein